MEEIKTSGDNITEFYKELALFCNKKGFTVGYIELRSPEALLVRLGQLESDH